MYSLYKMAPARRAKVVNIKSHPWFEDMNWDQLEMLVEAVRRLQQPVWPVRVVRSPNCGNRRIAERAEIAAACHADLCADVGI